MTQVITHPKSRPWALSRPQTLLLTNSTWAPLMACLSLILWLVGLAPVNPDQMDGFGLIRQLSPLVLASFPLVIGAGVAELVRERPRTWVAALVTALICLFMYGLQPAVEGLARLQVAWLHAGFADHVAATGDIVHEFDARFSWPAFFATAGFWARSAGFDSVVPMLDWAPLVLAGMASMAMYSLARAVFRSSSLDDSTSRRATWLATWLFMVGNWSEQDYFSPQAISYILLIAAFAVTMRFLVYPSPIAGGRVPMWRRLVPPSKSRDRIMAQGVVVLLAVVLAPTHPLTPYALVSMLTILLLWGRLSAGWLPVMTLVPPVVWFALGGREFWAGHLNWVTGPVGDIGGSVAEGVGDRLVGDLGHQMGVALRIALTCLMGLIALLGLAVLRKRGTRTFTLPALAGSAFAIAVVQPYGGEIFIRSYLFALPWFAIGGAIALAAILGRSGSIPAERTRTSVLGSACAVAVISLICLGSVTARGGNDAFLGVKQVDEDAMRFIYTHAEDGELVVGLTWNLPFRTQRLGTISQLTADDLQGSQRPCSAFENMAQCLIDNDVEYVVITPQQDNAGVILNGFPPGWTYAVAQRLVSGHGYEVVFATDGRIVLAQP
jgi:hypothetical protein